MNVVMSYVCCFGLCLLSKDKLLLTTRSILKICPFGSVFALRAQKPRCGMFDMIMLTVMALRIFSHALFPTP